MKENPEGVTVKQIIDATSADNSLKSETILRG
jgi:hypothetical protein